MICIIIFVDSSCLIPLYYVEVSNMQFLKMVDSKLFNEIFIDRVSQKYGTSWLSFDPLISQGSWNLVCYPKLINTTLGWCIQNKACQKYGQQVPTFDFLMGTYFSNFVCSYFALIPTFLWKKLRNTLKQWIPGTLYFSKTTLVLCHA